jgi:DNA-binding IclR family transcriptional regulator
MASVDTALGKGLRVLEALARADGPTRISHLATELGMQKSSLHRILQTLVELGFVTQDDGTSLYAATLKVWELGSAVVSALPIKLAASTILPELHQSTGETVSLSVRDGDDVLYLDKITSPRPIGFTTRVGSRVPAPMTAAGRVMLAFAPEDEAAAVLARVGKRLGPKVLDVDRARADLRKARRDGYLVGRGRIDRGIVGVATAVRRAGGDAVAGLTVSTPAQRFDATRQHEIVEALLIAAARLGEALG